jgi:hypothetical protein
VSYRSPVKEHLKVGSNELILHFRSAFLEVPAVWTSFAEFRLISLQGRDVEKKNGKRILWNGDSSRLYVRKAQYKSVRHLHVIFILISFMPVTDGTGVSLVITCGEVAHVSSQRSSSYDSRSVEDGQLAHIQDPHIRP